MPNPGTDSAYDEAMENLKNINNEMKDYLKKQCAYFGHKVKYNDNFFFHLNVLKK